MACREKYKPCILKYKALILKYVPYIFDVCKTLFFEMFGKSDFSRDFRMDFWGSADEKMRRRRGFAESGQRLV